MPELSALRRMFRLNKLVRRHAPAIRLLDESDNVRQGFIEPADFEAFLAAVREQEARDVADAAQFAYLSLWRRGNQQRRESRYAGGNVLSDRDGHRCLRLDDSDSQVRSHSQS